MNLYVKIKGYVWIFYSVGNGFANSKDSMIYFKKF